ncbi:hypothetical protein J5U18_10995 [Sphingobacteriaceae bacterium WQ 2009]|uniref:Fimbrillin-like n=1 Tax=Rhinopithecimicrobium faecis TaxID=2820698 RepID=A0A8T4HFG4_9SPHI|nr:hypothetical protein [Sphingobacteriaceae bacterium WQ 2009]
MNIFIHRFIILIIFPLLMLGCNKEAVKSKEANEKLIIEVSGIVDEYPAKIALKASSNKSSNHSHTDNKIITKELNGVTLQLSAGEIHTNGVRKVLKQQNQPKIAAAKSHLASTTTTSSRMIAMDANVSYRLILYAKNGDSFQFEQAVDLKSGRKTEIDIVKGVQYQWYAYSYNMEDDLSPLNDMSNPNIESSFDKELLYDAGTFSLRDIGSHHLHIKFKQQLSRIGLKVNSKGIFGTITAIKVHHLSEIPLSASIFNLKEGVFTNVARERKVNVGDTLTLKSLLGDKEILQAYYYSSTPLSLPKNFEVNLTNLAVEYDDKSTEVLIGENGKNTASQRLSFGDYQAAIGKSSVGNINLIHGGVNVGGIVWAKGNLYYDNGNYKFRLSGLFNYFQNTNENTANLIKSYSNTDYWYWMSERPDDSRPDWSQGKVDPCSKVYPANTWRMPDNATFEVLTNRSSNGKTDLLSHMPNGYNSMYVEFYNRGESSTDPKTEKLYFKADGRWETNNNRLRYEDYVLFWSSTQRTDVRSSSAYIANYLRVHNSNAVLMTMHDNLLTRRYNIRCVRNTNN